MSLILVLAGAVLEVNNETRRIDPSAVRIRTTIVEEDGGRSGCCLAATLVVTVNKKRVKTTASGWKDDAALRLLVFVIPHRGREEG